MGPFLRQRHRSISDQYAPPDEGPTKRPIGPARKGQSLQLSSDNAHKLVDLAVARPSFSARQVELELGISYGRANGLIAQLAALGVLEPVHANSTYDRRFEAPAVMNVLLADALI